VNRLLVASHLEVLNSLGTLKQSLPELQQQAAPRRD
jgi:hypothetical protein